MNEPLKPFPEEWKPLETELRTYHRILPQLLAEGDAGRYVVIRGTEVYETWDTFRDATQFGHRTFSDGQFMAQHVDPKMLEVLTTYFGTPEPLPAEVA
jgi:hypothetical protein